MTRRAALRTAALLSIVLLQSCAWRTRDQALLAFDLGCQVVDFAQTEDALDNGFREANPLLGDDPSERSLAGFKIGAAALATWAATQAEPQDRWKVLVAAAVPCVAAVAHNYSEGARP